MNDPLPIAAIAQNKRNTMTNPATIANPIAVQMTVETGRGSRMAKLKLQMLYQVGSTAVVVSVEDRLNTGRSQALRTR